MKKQIIIAAAIALVVGILIGTAIGTVVIKGNLAGTVIEPPTTTETVSKKYDIYYADDDGNPTGEPIGRCNKFTSYEILKTVTGEEMGRRLITSSYRYAFYLKEEEFLVLNVFSVMTNPGGEKRIQEVKSIVLNDENRGFSISYVPQAIQTFTKEGEEQNDTLDYIIKCDYRNTVLVDPSAN